jgi:nucleoid-associated protein YgaU
MSLTSFRIDAGEKLFCSAPDPVPPGSGAAIAVEAPTNAELNAVASASIAQYVVSQKLTAQDLAIAYDGASETVTVKGVAPDQATKEKIILCCGNVQFVAAVDDQLKVAQSSPAYPPSTTYEVKDADTLGDIAKSVYGDSSSEDTIFEANKPMLKAANQIYPGQRLRIPPKP